MAVKKDKQDLKNELHRITTTVLIYKPDGTYLITKRAMHKKVWPGKWTIPGGGLHINDYINTKPTTSGQGKIWYDVLSKVMKREMMEEVGLKVKDPELLTDMAFVRPDKVPVLVLSYFTPYVSGKVKLDDENTEYAWIKAKDVSKYDFIDGIDNEIREVDKILRSRKI